MTVNLTRIYTKLGDGGETHLGDMSRVPKTHPRIEAYGEVDELNALIGLALAAGGLDERTSAWLRRVQNELFDVGADLSVPPGRDEERPRLRGGGEYVEWLGGGWRRGGAAAAAGGRRVRGVAGEGLRRGQRDARAAEVVRASGRHAGRRPPP